LTRPGVVLDPFCGAATTALVAEELRRDWLGIELNPAYVELATERIRAARTKARPA
jgi:DNA modification methylase